MRKLFYAVVKEGNEKLVNKQVLGPYAEKRELGKLAGFYEWLTTEATPVLE